MIRKLYDYYRGKYNQQKLEDLKRKFGNITFCIKAFERPEAVKKLLNSIDKYYGILGKSLKIEIVDDSIKPVKPSLKIRNQLDYFVIKFDSGSSKGRNFLLDKVDTKYFLYLDDDYVFTSKTKIEKLFDKIESFDDIDILAGSIYNKGKRKVKSNCCIELKNGILKRIKKPKKIINGVKYYDFVVNFFLAKTSKIKLVKWDSEFKTVEHTAFFLNCYKKGLISAELEEVKINHIRPNSDKPKKI